MVSFARRFRQLSDPDCHLALLPTPRRYSASDERHFAEPSGATATLGRHPATVDWQTARLEPDVRQVPNRLEYPEPMTSPVSGVDAVRSALVRLRTRSGLSAERLRSTEVGVVSILELPVVRQLV